jgi:hypothetical protein
MVVRGQFMMNAHSQVDKVVDPGTKDYAIVVTVFPENDGYLMPCYAIRNKTTFVDERHYDDLPTALNELEEMQADLDDAQEIRAESLRLQ